MERRHGSLQGLAGMGGATIDRDLPGAAHRRADDGNVEQASLGQKSWCPARVIDVPGNHERVGVADVVDRQDGRPVYWQVLDATPPQLEQRAHRSVEHEHDEP